MSSGQLLIPIEYLEVPLPAACFLVRPPFWNKSAPLNVVLLLFLTSWHDFPFKSCRISECEMHFSHSHRGILVHICVNISHRGLSSIQHHDWERQAQGWPIKLQNKSSLSKHQIFHQPTSHTCKNIHFFPIEVPQAILILWKFMENLSLTLLFVSMSFEKRFLRAAGSCGRSFLI